jgi:hypothetical protein
MECNVCSEDLQMWATAIGVDAPFPTAIRGGDDSDASILHRVADLHSLAFNQVQPVSSYDILLLQSKLIRQAINTTD